MSYQRRPTFPNAKCLCLIRAKGRIIYQSVSINDEVYKKYILKIKDCQTIWQLFILLEPLAFNTLLKVPLEL